MANGNRKVRSIFLMLATKSNAICTLLCILVLDPSIWKSTMAIVNWLQQTKSYSFTRDHTVGMQMAALVSRKETISPRMDFTLKLWWLWSAASLQLMQRQLIVPLSPMIMRVLKDLETFWKKNGKIGWMLQQSHQQPLQSLLHLHFSSEEWSPSITLP